jgi:DNA modification methylase
MSVFRHDTGQVIAADRYQKLRLAALDQSAVNGLTHRFYRYPARFSPVFARAAILQFSQPGDVVLDPFMGGGTTLLEAVGVDRRAVGTDVNELAAFIARAKTTPLTRLETAAVAKWADKVIPRLTYNRASSSRAQTAQDRRTFNLNGPAARPIKKALQLALLHAPELSTSAAQNFVRCGLLNAGQWALNGRTRVPTLEEFRQRLRTTLKEMLSDIDLLLHAYAANSHAQCPAVFVTAAEHLPDLAAFQAGMLADLVITSPPYPGIHMLYHRWQVDGRRETPAPYWLSNCQDGNGAAFYTFGDRNSHTTAAYFEAAFRSFSGIRRVMKDGAFVVQMIAFSDASTQLSRYLEVMAASGFLECRGLLPSGNLRARTWRSVPGRRWHAMSKGKTPAAREVVLVHRAH